MEKIVERFTTYISYDTKSDEKSSTCPSTKGQVILGEKLVEELKELGITNAHQDEHGYVYASLEGNTDKVAPIGFVAHMDTSPDMDGKCVNPKIFLYEGGDVKLNDKYSLRVEEFPFLEDLVGQRLITTDGTTLLGSDDKAGIAAIMDAVEYLLDHPEIKRGDLKICFTPDEEIGRGADLFDVEKFGADFAYTIDGGPVGELEYENFNAASARIVIHGKNVHPGSAKNIMINAISLAMELDSMIPSVERPEHTEGYEGFYMLADIAGSVETCSMDYIIRDHSRQEFENKKNHMKACVDFLNEKYGSIIDLTIEDSYYNMREKIEGHMEIVDLARKSMEDLGIKADIKPIRGGTDGARLSYMGLPTPNIFTGGYNFHGRFEINTVEGMQKASQVIVKIVENHAK